MIDDVIREGQGVIREEFMEDAREQFLVDLRGATENGLMEGKRKESSKRVANWWDSYPEVRSNQNAEFGDRIPPNFLS